MDQLGKALEGIAKVVAVLATVSLVMAFVYNVAYFLHNLSMLGYLTMSDHIATAITIIPFVALVQGLNVLFSYVTTRPGVIVASAVISRIGAQERRRRWLYIVPLILLPWVIPL